MNKVLKFIKLYFPIVVGITVVLLYISMVYAIIAVPGGYRLNKAGDAGENDFGEINAHGTCRRLTNTGANDYFVPTNTAAEWNAFLTFGFPGLWVELVDTSLLAYWSFDDDPNINGVHDYSCSDSEGVNNLAGWEVGGNCISGRCIDFTGAADYINAGSNANLDNIFNGGGTVSAWINPQSWGPGGFGRILAKEIRDNEGWSFILDNVGAEDETLCLVVQFSGGESHWCTPTASISLNTWQHVVATYDSSSRLNDPTIYINGQPRANDDIDRAGAGSYVVDDGLSFFIGETTTFDRGFDGLIDGVRIYNRVLSAVEVEALCDSDLGADCSTL